MIWLSQHIHLGDLPTWLTAIGAFTAAGFAFGQLRTLRAQNQLQQKQIDSQAKELARVERTQRKQTELLDLEIRDRRSAQARLVRVRRVVLPWQNPGSGVENGFAQVLRVTNSSQGPISDLDAFFAMENNSPQRALYSSDPDVTARPRGWAAEVKPGQRDLGFVPIARLDVDQTIDLIGPVYSEDKATETRNELLFTDSEGRRWRVDHSGQLTEDGPATSA